MEVGKMIGRIRGLLGAVALLLAGCGGGADGRQLQLAGAVDRPADYSGSALRRLPATTASSTIVTSSQVRSYTGVGTWALLDGAGIQTDASKKNDVLNRYLLATGANGYKVVFSLGELHPDFGNMASLVAYAETLNGVSSSLGSSDEPLRITAPGDVTGGRYVSALARLDVKASGSSVVGSGSGSGSGSGVAPSVAVSGAVTAPRQFDLAALQALPATAQTVGGSVYTGVSLWTLLNTVTGLRYDSTVKNATLAMYAVATGSDGYKALVSLGEIDPGVGNRTALVAYSVDGAPLGRNGVARLVVPGDTKLGRSVSNLQSIEVFTAADAVR